MGVREMRQITLRRLLVLGLVAFAIVPALVAIALSFWQSYAVVDTLTQRIVRDVAVRIEQETLRHLYKPHFVLNGLLPPAMSAQQAAQAKKLFDKPAEFEQLAFALTAQLSEVPYLYYGTQQGNFLGVEFYPEGTRVGIRGSQDIGRKSYLASAPGDRSVFVKQEEESYEPRNRPWYKSAEASSGRAFTRVYPSASKRQLVVTLSQAVPDDKGETALVVAADLSLDRLSETLRSSRISANAASYIVDESGDLVAASTSERLYKVNVDLLQRVTPLDSTDTFITQSFLHLAPQLGLSKVVQVHLAAGKAVAGSKKGQEIAGNTITDNAVLVTLPVGESLNLKWHLVIAAQHTDFSSVVTQSLNRVLTVVMLLVLLAGGLAWALAGDLSRRIDQLSQMAHRLGLGQVPSRISSRIADVALLSDAMHTSGVQLQASRQDIEHKAQALEQANLTLEHRVTERTSELAASREEALDAVRAKAAFLATMSHEIRTPLNGVVGMTSLLADTPLSPEQREYLHTMNVSSDQLLGVINNILDFSKIESGKLVLEAEPLSLQATVKEACDMLAARTREKGLALRVDVAADVPAWVRGDVTRLRQLLLNYINNAIKFTERGRVEVSVRLQAVAAPGASALIEFRVTDTGMGIAPEHQHALFQSFSQMDASTTRKYGGTGLGLAICKRLAEQMGGSVGVLSATGKGATFWFTAQLAPADAPAAVAGQAPAGSVAGNQRILVADDNPVNLKVVQAMLAKLGYTVVTAADGRAAADAVQQSLPEPGQTFALVLMDANMPVMDGCEAARLIIASHGAAAPPIIALTASVLEQDRQRCMDAGMVGFLTKPLRMDDLAKALALHLRPADATKTGAARAHIHWSAALNEGQKQPVLMDWTRLEQLKPFDDEQQTMTREILSLFIADLPSRSQALHAALAAQDSTALAHAAHSLTGAASNVGASALSQASAELEQACLQDVWPLSAGQQVSTLLAWCEPTLAELQQWLGAHPAKM